MNNKIQLAKLGAKIVVHLGTGTIVNAIVRNNVAPANAFEKISIPAGSFAIGGIVANAAKQYTEDLIDDIVNAVSKAKDEDTTV